jgi:4-carboxymuconolactone decarboxylase
MSDMPRIFPAGEPLSATLTESMNKLLRPGTPAPQIFLTVARNEGLFNYLVQTGLLGPTGLMDRKVLAPPLREMIILRTCVSANNVYEFNLHVQTISERMGLSRAQIDDLKSAVPSTALWSPAEQALWPLIDQLVKSLSLSDGAFAAARSHYDEATLIEIVQLIGLYTGVAMQVALSRPAMDKYRPGAREQL